MDIFGSTIVHDVVNKGDQVLKHFQVPGAGRMLAEDYRPPTTQPAPGAAPNANGEGTGSRGASAMACCRVNGAPAVCAGKKELADNKTMRNAHRIKRIGVIRACSDRKAMKRRQRSHKRSAWHEMSRTLIAGETLEKNECSG